MAKRSIAAMVLFETDDSRLFPENLNVSSVAATEALRTAVVAALPSLTRVVMVLSEEHARLMCAAHAMAAQQSGLENLIDVPPSAYRANDRPPPYYPGVSNRRRRG